MLRSIVIDDEGECIDTMLLDLAEHCPQVNVVATCPSGKDAVKAIHKHAPDLIFLDIDMPVVNGFDVLEMVKDIDFEVIFTTAYDKYAVQAFKISAVDYLLKPIDQEELRKAVKKVQVLKERGNTQQQLSFLMEQIRDIENNDVKKIAVPTFDGLEFIRLDDILYCQSDGSYSHIFFVDGRKLYLSKTLRYLEDSLCDYHFFRVHNSYIVNLNFVEKYARTDGGILEMKNGVKIRVSRLKRDELLNRF